MSNRSLLTLATALASLYATMALALPTGPPVDVPEPVSLGLLATAVGGLAWLKFRRR